MVHPMIALMLLSLTALAVPSPASDEAPLPINNWHALAPDDAGVRTVQAEAEPIARIYNGAPTAAYPAVAGLLILTPTGLSLCTGTLIAPSVVLTAAHCFDDNPIAAVAGFFPDGFTERAYRAVGYAIHPGYSRDVLAYADIALVAFATSVAGVGPIPVPSAPPRPRRTGAILGFGQDEVGQIGLKEIGAVKLRRCPRAFRPGGLSNGQLATSLCWRPTKRGQDTCHGDSGGPLIVDGAVAGITSGGYPDCPGRLSWDTNVALFRPWIESLVATAQ